MVSDSEANLLETCQLSRLPCPFSNHCSLHKNYSLCFKQSYFIHKNTLCHSDFSPLHIPPTLSKRSNSSLDFKFFKAHEDQVSQFAYIFLGKLYAWLLPPLELIICSSPVGFPLNPSKQDFRAQLNNLRGCDIRLNHCFFFLQSCVSAFLRKFHSTCHSNQ